ncbi:MAG: adenosine deaminase, partial [Phenylobacterium sp.]
FLDIYYQGAAVLLTEEDFHDLALAYFRRAGADGAVRCEIFFDPQTHTDRGLPFRVAIEGLLSGMAAAEAELGLSSGLILCFLRHLPESAAMETLRAAEPWLDRLLGVGLDSSEAGFPPSGFREVFRAAGERGLKRVAHAGEEGPPAYVAEALDLLHVDRIDHGNRALEDKALTARLVREGQVLTVCPLSNLKLCGVPSLDVHPLKRMLQLGLKATVNSDDPAYFGGYLLDNWVQVTRAVGLDRSDLVTLARNSLEGGFWSQAEQAPHLARLEALAAGQ